MTDASVMLALLYAGPDAVVVQTVDGALEVAPPHRAYGSVLLTQQQLLDEGMDALLALTS